MLTRLARERLCAACAAGLLTWLTAYGLTLPVRAQNIVGEQGDAGWQTQDELAPDGWEEYDDLGYGSSCGDTCGCGDACCDTCCDGSHMQDGCSYCPEAGYWFGAELLLWRIDGMRLPALVTDSPIGDEPDLGSSTTQILAGNEVTGNSWRSGYQLDFGVWMDECRSIALVGEYFNAGQDDYDYFYPGSSGRVTGRPYLNADTGLPDAWIISNPADDVDGTISVIADDDFQGAGLSLVESVYAIGDMSGYGTSSQVWLIGGYRYYGYDSNLWIHDTRVDMAGEISRRDRFSTNNRFHGGEIGLLARSTQNGCWFEGMAKVAIGGHRKRATIRGTTEITPSMMATQIEQGGLLTSDVTNIGSISDSRVRFIPTFRLGIGAYLTPNWTFKAGYSAIVWGGVARAAGIMPPNLAVDPNNVPDLPGGTGGAGVAPVFPGIGGSELVAHGLDLGFEYRY